jgi:pyruvate dehydrogenase E1 component alpha subunit
MMQLCRQFETACIKAYMQGEIRGYMHTDNGQEAIPALIAVALKRGDLKLSDYRVSQSRNPRISPRAPWLKAGGSRRHLPDSCGRAPAVSAMPALSLTPRLAPHPQGHTHALASGVSPDAIMAEIYGKQGGSCRGSGGSMHIYDKALNFQGGWALVAEQLPYAAGAARSILLDRQLHPNELKDDDRIAVVFIGDGGAQNGRMAECLNAAAKEKLPLLFIVIDNGRAISTFTPDVAANSNVYLQGKHYGIPGLKVYGSKVDQTLKAGRAVIDYVRKVGPAILQVHTYRLQGHNPTDSEDQKGRKEEKEWARNEADPIKLFEASARAKELDLEGGRDGPRCGA